MKYTDRKHPRLKMFDYGAGGTFCVTVCSKDKKKIFGRVIGEAEVQVELSPLGTLVRETILRIPKAYTGVKLLNWVVMPNHIHLLVQVPEQTPVSLFAIVRSTKAIVTRQWGQPVWQSSYYEHIVRNEADALRFWQYIDENPIKWSLDQYYN